MTTTVDATGPWGVSALLEAVMAAEARQASSDFFRFAAVS